MGSLPSSMYHVTASCKRPILDLIQSSSRKNDTSDFCNIEYYRQFSAFINAGQRFPFVTQLVDLRLDLLKNNKLCIYTNGVQAYITDANTFTKGTLLN